MLYEWRFWARPEQRHPAGDWRAWLLLSGRGFGKTRTGAEWIRERVAAGCSRIALVGQTVADVRDVMIEGESGLLACYPPQERPVYRPSLRTVEFANGAIAKTYSGDQPDQLRGPQHDAAWLDELCKFQYPADCWDNLEFGLRLGENPQVVVTTTPRPIEIIRQLVADPLCHVTRGSTYDNRANLPAVVIKRFEQKYSGTRLGRQELLGEILDDTPGALWTHALIESARVRVAPELVRIVLAIDPAVTAGEEADETGLVAAGIGVDGRGYVLKDLSCRLSSDGWCRRAVTAFHELQADRIVAEVNNGGDLVERVLRVVDRSVPYKAVHASRGKQKRAEPIAALYEQGRISHVGMFGDLESQMCTYVPGEYDGSPDRMDALVWALTDLFLESKQPNIRAL